MNPKNTDSAARLFSGELRRSASGIFTLTLADGDQLAFPAPVIDATTDEVEAGEEAKEPRLRRYVEKDAVGREVNRVLWSLLSFSQERKRVMHDHRLTQAGREEAIREPRQVAIVNSADAWQRVDEHEVSLIEREAELYSVPTLAPADAVGALRDMEVRSWFRSLDGDKRLAALADLARGDSEFLAHALLRSPISIGEAEKVVRQAHRTAVERRNRDAVEQLRMQTEQLRAGRLLMQRAAKKIMEKADLQGYELYSVAAGFTPAMPSGPAVFGFAPDELRAYRARWEATRQRAA